MRPILSPKTAYACQSCILFSRYITSHLFILKFTCSSTTHSPSADSALSQLSDYFHQAAASVFPHSQWHKEINPRPSKDSSSNSLLFSNNLRLIQFSPTLFHPPLVYKMALSFPVAAGDVFGKKKKKKNTRSCHSVILLSFVITFPSFAFKSYLYISNSNISIFISSCLKDLTVNTTEKSTTTGT